MANLDGYNAENHDPLDSFEAIPAGDYRAMATDSEMRPTKAGTGSYLQITWELLDEPYRSRKLWSRLNLENPNTQAVEIAQRELSSICRAVGILRPKDSAEFHGVPISLKVGVEKRQDYGELANRIKGYASVNGEQSAAPPAPAQASAPAKPPWQR